MGRSSAISKRLCVLILSEIFEPSFIVVAFLLKFFVVNKLFQIIYDIINFAILAYTPVSRSCPVV